MYNSARARQILAYYEDNFGVYFPVEAVEILDEGRQAWGRDIYLAMDAQPQLVTTPNGGIPSFLTTIVDPSLLQILTSPLKAVEIFGEQRKGTWEDITVMFSVVEHTGTVASYDDYATSGSSSVNTNFPQRQAYLYQTITQWGELELARAGRAKINWANETRASAVKALNVFQNLTYIRGVKGLQNYGLQTDPNLPAPIAPAPKQWGGLSWYNGSFLAATANEVYNDILSLYGLLVAQAGGNIDEDTPLTLVMAPSSSVALKITNSFNVNVKTLLEENFKKLRIVTAVQWGQATAQNNQGVAAGNLMTMIADEVEGQDTGFCAFNEKMRSHPIIRAESSFRQKQTQGTFGAVIRQPFAFAQMLGI